MGYPRAPRQPATLRWIEGPLERVTAPTLDPLTLEELKLHCKVDHTADDSHLTNCAKAAVEYVEDAIPGNWQILQATYDLPVACWWEELRLPRPPLQSVTWIKYYDTAGTQQTLATTYYQVRTPWRQPGRIHRAALQSWPGLQVDRPYPITVRLVCGAAAASAVPYKLKQAVLMLTEHWYLNREAIGEVNGEMALAVTRLCEQSGWGFYG
jgi:uncharacterized phiE125 gp8 family phage protein